MGEEPTIEEGRAAMAVARAFLLSLGARSGRVQEADLGGLMGEVAGLGRAVEAATVAVAAEADGRGLPAQAGPSGSLGGDLKAWVGERSPGVPGPDLARVARLVRAGRTHTHAPLLEALTAGRVGLRVADVCLTELVRMKDFFEPAVVPAVWEGYLGVAEGGDLRRIRSARQELLAQHAGPDRFQDLTDAAARFVSLSSPRLVDGPSSVGDLWRYTLVTDTEGKSVVEAAIGPLSAPVPGPDGEPDTRLPERRRAQALVGMLRRGVAAGDRVPSVTKTQLILTATVEDLVEGAGRTGAGRVLGSLDPGLLAPETLRRLTCDTTVAPMVVGQGGDLLHAGRTRRLFTPTQLKALWLRDGGCTYPACTAAAHWTDAHHLRHWADGGPTDLENAALLCAFHHTLVHQRRLHGGLEPPDPTAGQRDPTRGASQPPTPRRVRWDTDPGSYDRVLAGSLSPPAA